MITKTPIYWLAIALSVGVIHYILRKFNIYTNASYGYLAISLLGVACIMTYFARRSIARNRRVGPFIIIIILSGVTLFTLSLGVGITLPTITIIIATTLLLTLTLFELSRRWR